MADLQFDGRVHCCDHGSWWASRRHVIYRSDDEGKSWQAIVQLPISGKARWQSCTRLLARLFRMNVYHLQVVEQRYLSVLGFGFYFAFDLHEEGRLLASGRLQGKRPLVYCKTANGRLLYGEYHGNKDRQAVSIWASDDGGCTWRAAHVLRDVRHVHGVFQDPYTDAIWFTTGDTDEESAIWRAKPDFTEVERVFFGSQQARAITLEFSADKIFFGSDTPLEKNYLYSLTRSTNEVEQLAEVDGSVFHSCRVGEMMYFSTACEPSEINQSRCASVYQVTDAGHCQLTSSWPKDAWGMRYFQYGQVFFASGQSEKVGVWVTPFATAGDQKSIVIKPVLESGSDLHE